MKKSKVIFLALLACACGAVAETTTTYDAELVARGWGRLNASAFGSLGDVRSVTAETGAAGNTLWYVVKMSKGAVIVAPDDEIEPVIAVLPKSDGVLAANDPLRAMLMRDMPQRLRGLNPGGSGMKLLALNVAAAASAPSAASAKWNKLRANGGTLRLAAMADSGTPATVVRLLDGWNSDSKEGDVQTLRFWNQDKSDDYFTNASVFDLYTPGNSPCGCVATAGASVMHYFRVPSGKKVTKKCSYNGTTMSLTTKGGTYDWSLIDDLDLVRGVPVTLSDDAADLLGRVAYDCGVGCGMYYGDDGSGSNTHSLMQSFRNVFGVQNAQLVTKSGGDYGGGENADVGADTYANVIYNQIRGGAPVVLGIDGHEVVACGYGYDTDNTDYTYVFLGWGGANDAWYALPNIDTKATVEGGWYTSTFVDELITEIAPEDDKFVAVVGRLVDADGDPVAGDTITMANGEVLVTDENGYWGTRVSPTDECYVIDSIGELHDYELGDMAKATTAGGCASAALADAMPDAMTIELLEPSVRVGGEGGVVYGSLTSALKAVAPGETVEILQPTVFKRSVTVEADCTVFATNADAAASGVTHGNAALMTVTNAAVTLSNVVFTASTDTLVSVEEGGCLKLGPQVDMGVDLEHVAVRTADANGFELAGALQRKFLFRCAVATNQTQAFGTYSCSREIAERDAVKIVCADDIDRETRGAVGPGNTLVWAHADVPVDEAAGYYVDNDGKTHTYYRLERAVDEFAQAYAEGLASEFVVRKDGALPVRFAVTKPLVIRGEGDPRPVLTVEMDTSFAIEEGGSLVISNLVFLGTADERFDSDYGFIEVDGGELTIDYGVEFNGITRHVDFASGIVDLLAGKATMKNGAAILNCRAMGGACGAGLGGAIYVEGAGCELNLEGGTISGCYAATAGGGVYANASDDDAGIVLSGDLIVADNAAGDDYETASGIYIAKSNAVSTFVLNGELRGKVALLYPGFGAGNEEGDAFIVNTLGAAVSETTLRSFVCDADETLMGAVGEDGMLVWVKMVDDGQCTPGDAVALLIDAAGVTNYYASVARAFAYMGDNSPYAVEMLADDVLADFTVRAGCDVTLRRAAGAGSVALTRDEDVGIVVPADASLTLENVALCGFGYTSALIEKSCISVEGGALTLAAGVRISDIFGNASRAANAVTVSAGGTFTMLPGAEIVRCENEYSLGKEASETQHYGVGGGVLIDGGSTAYLRGGEISECRATRGGGVCVCNGSVAYVSEKMRIVGNYRRDDRRYALDGKESNLLVEDNSELYVDGELTNKIGTGDFVQWQRDTNLVAKVSADWVWTTDALTNSAAQFSHDKLAGVVGVAVTNGTDALIVWSNAVTEDERTFTYGGVTYALAGELPALQYTVTTNTPGPLAFTAVAHGETCTVTLEDLVAGAKYSLYRTNSLAGGFAVEGVAPFTNFTAEADGPLELELPLDKPPVFWRATGEETYTTNYFNK